MKKISIVSLIGVSLAVMMLSGCFFPYWDDEGGGGRGGGHHEGGHHEGGEHH